MKSRKNAICRLCLQTIVDQDFNEMGKIIKEILAVLLLKINLSISKTPVICRKCEDNIIRFFEFKSTWLHTEDKIFPYITDNPKLDLREIYIKVKDEVKAIGQGNFKMLNEIQNETDLIKHTLQKYFPEMNLTVTEDPVICDICVNSMLNFYFFATDCMNTERKLYIYRQIKNLNSISKVNLSNVQSMEFNEKNDDMGRIVSFQIKMETYVKKGIITFDARNGADAAEDLAGDSSGCNSSPIMILWPPKKKPEKRKQPLKTKTIAPSRRFKCNICAYKTPYRPQLVLHMLVHKDPFDLTMLKCKLCPFETKHKYYLRKHMQNRHTNVKKFKCDLCTFETTRKALLTAHFATHPSKVTIYQCQQCKYSTSYKPSFKSHIFVHMDPSEITMHKCDACPFETKHSRSLRLHKTVMHDQRRPTETFKCHNCSYESKLKHNLVIHMLSHRKLSELTMHKCATCEYQSRHLSNLRAHELTHREPVNPTDTTYKCKICTFETKQRESFNDHIRYHKKQKQDLFLCDECNFVCKQKSGLNTHKLVHKKTSEVVAFRCSLCSFESKYKQHINRHMLRHKDPSEVDMFKCDICLYETNRKDALKEHIIKRHKM